VGDIFPFPFWLHPAGSTFNVGPLGFVDSDMYFTLFSVEAAPPPPFSQGCCDFDVRLLLAFPPGDFSVSPPRFRSFNLSFFFVLRCFLFSGLPGNAGGKFALSAVPFFRRFFLFQALISPFSPGPPGFPKMFRYSAPVDTPFRVFPPFLRVATHH